MKINLSDDSILWSREILGTIFETFYVEGDVVYGSIVDE